MAHVVVVGRGQACLVRVSGSGDNQVELLSPGLSSRADGGGGQYGVTDRNRLVHRDRPETSLNDIQVGQALSPLGGIVSDEHSEIEFGDSRGADRQLAVDTTRRAVD